MLIGKQRPSTSLNPSGQVGLNPMSGSKHSPSEFFKKEGQSMSKLPPSGIFKLQRGLVDPSGQRFGKTIENSAPGGSKKSRFPPSLKYSAAVVMASFTDIPPAIAASIPPETKGFKASTGISVYPSLNKFFTSMLSPNVFSSPCMIWASPMFPKAFITIFSTSFPATAPEATPSTMFKVAS